MDDYREWLKNTGYCINCCKEKAEVNKTRCMKCLEKLKDDTRKYRAKGKEYQKRKREICIAFRVCRECLKRDAKVGQKCLECSVKSLKRAKKNRDKNNVLSSEVKSYLGICYFCNRKAIEGKKVCEEHYKTCIKNLNYKRDISNHIWRKIIDAEVKINLQNIKIER